MASVDTSSAQDVIRCDICPGEEANRSPVQVCCNSCRVNMCGACVPRHMLLDKSIKHDVVLFTERTAAVAGFPNCKTHQSQVCNLYCNPCDIAVCTKCLTGSHNMHQVSDLKEILELRRDIIKQDVDELRNLIIPEYQDINSTINIRINNKTEEFDTMNSSIDEHGEAIHGAVDILLKNFKTNAEKMKTEELHILRENSKEINDLYVVACQELKANSKILETNDFDKMIEYKSRNQELRRVPPQIQMSRSKFHEGNVCMKQLQQVLGRIESSTKTRIQGYIISTSMRKNNLDLLSSSSSSRRILDLPRIVIVIKNRYDHTWSTTFTASGQLWISGKSGLSGALKRFDRNGSILETIATGMLPTSLTNVFDEQIICCEYGDVKIVKDDKLITILYQRNWIAKAVCRTSSSETIVCFVSEDGRQCKIVRYFGSNVTQEIQHNGNGEPLFAGYYFGPYFIDVNKNGDICLIDKTAVVVVDKLGNLRFRYKGNLDLYLQEPFCPRGIVTDSESRILVGDEHNNCVHVLDKDGHFLCLITCGEQLHRPHHLCIDMAGKLCITEYDTGNIKLVEYLE